MQTIGHDGQRGPTTPFDKDKMTEMLEDPAIKEVRVFKEPEETLLEKTLERHKAKREASEQQKPSTQSALPTPPRRIKGFLLQKDMKINLHGTLYKVVTARSNGKVAMKFVRFIEEDKRSSR